MVDIIGLAMGTEVDVVAYVTNRYFGLRSFGTEYGLFWTAILSGIAAGPLIYGINFEATGSYTIMLFVSVGMIIASVVILLFVRRYPDWEQVATGR